MPNDSFEVAIAGGGVAGSSLATVLARAGLRVVLVEREARFRDRIRGEGIHPWGVAEVHRAGLAELLGAASAQELPIWQRYSDRVPEPPFQWSEVSIDRLPELGVSHPRLQQAAISSAVAAGVTLLRPAKVVEARRSPRRQLTIDHNGTTRTLSARLLVGADGRNSATRKWLGATTLRDPEHHRIGGVLLDEVELAEDAAHEAPIEGGRVFILPQGNRRARAYIVTAVERNGEVQRDTSGTAALALLRDLFPAGSLDRARIAGPIAFFSNADYWSDRLAAPGIVLIGDAAGANDPSVGNGLSLAFRDVRELSALLLDSDDWSQAVEEFATRRAQYFSVLRDHASWVAMLVSDEGPEADERRARVAIARESDPTAGGFTLIFARGPDGLVVDEAAQARFFGEHESGGRS